MDRITGVIIKVIEQVGSSYGRIKAGEDFYFFHASDVEGRFERGDVVGFEPFPALAGEKTPRARVVKIMSHPAEMPL